MHPKESSTQTYVKNYQSFEWVRPVLCVLGKELAFKYSKHRRCTICVPFPANLVKHAWDRAKKANNDCLRA